MKFKVDENLPVEVAEFLRTRGFDAQTVYDENLIGAEDASIFMVCQSEERIILTMDLDFADLQRYPPVDTAGIVVLRLNQQRRDYILAFMPRLIRLLETEHVAGSLCIVDEIRTRIRKAR